jgi:hypothetical protein
MLMPYEPTPSLGDEEGERLELEQIVKDGPLVPNPGFLDARDER